MERTESEPAGAGELQMVGAWRCGIRAPGKAGEWIVDEGEGPGHHATTAGGATAQAQLVLIGRCGRRQATVVVRGDSFMLPRDMPHIFVGSPSTGPRLPERGRLHADLSHRISV